MILKFESVTKRFGGFTVVDDVSFQVNKGEFVTLLGPSGCGKTTILRMIAGFEWPSEGNILIAGKSMKGVMPYNRPLGMVFQGLALFPHMSVGENVAFGLQLRRVQRMEREKRVANALELVGLSGFQSRRIHEMSGGQRQRVALARALVIEPDVLLLDEPLGALDLKLRRQLQIELKHIQRRVGTTFIFVTHDQEEALTMSDRIAVVNDGRIEQFGSAEEVYEKPATPFVAGFLGEANFLSGEIENSGPNQIQITIAELDRTITVPTALYPHSSHGQSSDITLAVRPEWVTLGPQATEGDVALNGTVVDKVYAGSNFRFEIEANRTRFTVVAKATDTGLREMQLGDEVTLGWKVEDTCYLTPQNSPHIKVEN